MSDRKTSGEPVAHTMKSVMSAICSIDGFPMLTSNQCHALAAKLNAEQPAPVAAVLPPKRETQPFRTIDRGSDNYTAGWNAYANELKRLNPSL